MNNSLLIRKGIILLMLFVLLSLVGCSQADQLYLGEGDGAVCMPGKTGESRTYAGTYVVHEGNREVTILEISLVNPKDVVLLEASFLEVDPSDTYLVGYVNWPLEKIPLLWNERISVEGAVLKPGDERNLVVVVTSQAQDIASFEGVRIVYKDGLGRKYEQNTLDWCYISSNGCDGVLDEYYHK